MARPSKIGSDERIGGMEAAAAIPFGDESVTRVVTWPIEAWLRCQAGILKAAQPVTAGWIERRREGATAALETFERLVLCKDWEEAASIQRNWIEESMKRLDSDLHAFSDQALAIAQEAMSATRYAAQSSSDVVALAIKPVQRAAADVQQRVDAAA